MALLDVAERPEVHSDHLQQCLRSVARMGGLDFYLEERVVPGGPNRLFPQSMQCPAGASKLPPHIKPAAQRLPCLRRRGFNG